MLKKTGDSLEPSFPLPAGGGCSVMSKKCRWCFRTVGLLSLSNSSTMEPCVLTHKAASVRCPGPSLVRLAPATTPTRQLSLLSSLQFSPGEIQAHASIFDCHMCRLCFASPTGVAVACLIIMSHTILEKKQECKSHHRPLSKLLRLKYVSYYVADETRICLVGW